MEISTCIYSDFRELIVKLSKLNFFGWKSLKPLFFLKKKKLRKLLRFWYLLHMGVAKSQTNLHICAVLPEPSLLSHIKYECRWR